MSMSDNRWNKAGWKLETMKENNSIRDEAIMTMQSKGKAMEFEGESIILEGNIPGNISGEQGWRSGESTGLPPMWRGFDSQTRRHMWVEFVGSLLCSARFFSGYSGFPLSSKTNI